MAIHERMPVVIPREQFGRWLDPAEHDVDKLSKLLRPFHPEEMTAYPVSTLVNNVKADAAKCIEPLLHAEPSLDIRLREAGGPEACG